MKILRMLLIISAIFLACITALAGIFILLAETTGSQFYIYTHGTILQVSSNSEQGEMARVRFRTKEQATITIEMPNAFPRYGVGATVPIKYRPEQPTDAYNAAFAANGLLGVGLIWFSFLCIALIGGPRIFRSYVWRQVAISIRLQRRSNSPTK
jgi:hypothetical protein